jgi:hypothetical protein
MLLSALMRQRATEVCRSRYAGSVYQRDSSPCTRPILACLGIVLKLIALFGMSACATQAQRQAEAIATGIRESHEVAKNCIENANSSFAHTNLYQRFPPPPVSLAHLADTTVPSEQDRQDLIAYHAATLPCRTQMLDGYRQVAPTLATITREYFDVLDVIYLRLAEGGTSIRYHKSMIRAVRLFGWTLALRHWNGVAVVL